jgi:hypothetical protein
MSDTGTEQDVQLIPVKKPGTDETIMVTPEVKELMNDMVSIARKDATGKAENKFKPIKDMLSKLEEENGGLSEELESFKESQMSEAEKAQSRFKKDLEKYKESEATALEKKEYWKTKYKDNKITNDIYSAFSGHKLSNPEHAAILFKNSVETDIQPMLDSEGNQTGEFTTKMKMIVSDGNGGYKEQEGTPGELFKIWIEQDSNKHLLLNNLVPGGGSSASGNLENLSEVDKLRAQYEEAKKNGDGVKMMHLKTKIQKAAAENG